MLSVRNAILTAITVFVMALVVATVSLMGAPDSHGAAIDSFGTRRDGFRAVFELLSAFNVPVERRIEPPSPDLPVSITLVLWMPHDDLVSNEPVYLERLLPWIKRGGRLVISVPPPGRNWAATVTSISSNAASHDLWSALELKGVRSVPISLDEAIDGRKNDTPLPNFEEGSSTVNHDRIRRSLESAMGMHPIHFMTVPAIATGSFEQLQNRVQQLQIPVQQIGGLKIDSSLETSGKIEFASDDGTPLTIAATFQRGHGEIVVVAEPMLLMNASLGHADNGVFAYDLLTKGGGRVVFDEFYHGLSVRGNPLWLLTKSTYATVMLGLLGLLALELWRRAILLGPPLEAAAKTRRTIIEYIDAMARFLNRGGASRSFLLTEIRSGVLRTMSDRIGLSATVHDPEVIASTLAKRSLRDAEQFRQAMQLLDVALVKGKSVSEFEAIRVLQRITSCL